MQRQRDNSNLLVSYAWDGIDKLIPSLENLRLMYTRAFSAEKKIVRQKLTNVAYFKYVTHKHTSYKLELL